MPPLVSIGLPVYNGEPYLDQAIESILAQDFTDFELIISDNASTDQTQQICERHAALDERVVYSRLPENLGAAPNYNRVFEMASGTYFKWAAHDDIVAPGFIGACIAEFERHEVPPIIVHPAAEFIDADGVVLRPHSDTMHVVDDHPAMRVLRVAQRQSMIASVFGMFHRESLARTRLIGSFISSDYALLIEAAIVGKIVFVSGSPLFQRRIHPGMSRQANVSDEEVLRWFDPKARSRLTNRQRLYLEYFRSVRSVEGVSALTRTACAVAVAAGVTFSRSRVNLGRWRRQLMAKLGRD